MEKRLLVIANIGFIIGIIIGLYFEESITLFLSIFVIIVFVKFIVMYFTKMIVIAKIKRILNKLFTKKVVITFVIFLLLGTLLITLKKVKFEKFLDEMAIFQNSNIKVYATVISDKEEKEYSDVYKVQVLSISNKKYHNTNCILKLNKSDTNMLSYGDLICFSGEFQEPQARSNFNGYSYKEYLRTINVYGTFKSKYSDVNVLEKKSCNMLYILANEARNSLTVQIDKLYKEEGALLKGILLGEKDELTEEQVENFKTSNLSHILAVSGMHIAYIIAGTMFILKFLGVTKKINNILTICIIIFFMFLTNFTPSVVRASIMVILTLIAFLLKRKADVFINISIASLTILLCNPYAVLSLSYQLSFLGTIGIVLGMRALNLYKITKLQKSHCKNSMMKLSRFKKKIGKILVEIVCVCLSAQIFVFPIILLNFNTISIYFLLSNIIVTPIIGAIIILGFVSIFVSYIFVPLANIISIVETALLSYMNNMTIFITNLPNSIIYLKTPYMTSIVLYYAVILIFVGIYISKETFFARVILMYKKILLKILRKILALYIAIIIVLDLNLFCQNGLEIYFVDVGQGDCTLIVTDNNTKILIDGGGSNNKNYDIGKNTTLPYLLDRRINCLDYVIISHFDSDHVQGLFAVLNNIKVKNIVIAWQKESSDNYEKMLEIARSNNIKIKVVEAGDRILFDKNTYLDILWPNSQNMISENFLNNNSIVAKLVYKTFSILFTGDIEGVAEKAIIDTNANALNATVLKVAHHGSKTSSIIDFLKSVKPKIALIGVGENNIFGHPSQITLNNLNLIGTQVYRTDKNGEIVITVNRWNQKISVNTFNNISK